MYISCEFVCIDINDDYINTYLKFIDTYLTNAGGWKGRDGIFSTGRRPICVQARPQPHVRVHDQLHPEAQEPAGEVHDEQRAGELHHPSGETICQ